MAGQAHRVGNMALGYRNSPAASLGADPERGAALTDTPGLAITLPVPRTWLEAEWQSCIATLLQVVTAPQIQKLQLRVKKSTITLKPNLCLKRDYKIPYL